MHQDNNQIKKNSRINNNNNKIIKIKITIRCLINLRNFGVEKINILLFYLIYRKLAIL
jgi:hypothetical protein